jgi:hypothetical protein
VDNLFDKNKLYPPKVGKSKKLPEYEKKCIESRKFINALNNFLFWDIDSKKIDAFRDKNIIIERALLRGDESDEVLVFSFYPEKDIIEVVCGLKNMPVKICNYLSFRLNIEKERFACYNRKQWI